MSKSKTSGPIEINHYTYGVLYDRFLVKMLPTLNPPDAKPVDRRAFPPMENIFNPPLEDEDQCKPKNSMLKKAQTIVLAEIDRQHKQSRRAGRISGLERMFYLATGEKDLIVDWDMMRNAEPQGEP